VHFQEILQHYGYAGVFFIIFVEAIGFPFPAETTLTLAGIEWSKGVFHLVPLWLMGCLGNLVGSAVAFFIGWFLGRPVVLYFGKYVGITDKKLDMVNERFQRYELAVIFIAKFIAGVRIIVPYLAGINRMNPAKFFTVNTIAAIVWSGAFIIAGKYIGEEVSRYWPFLKHHLWLAAILAAIVVALLLAFRRWERKKMHGSAPDAKRDGAER